MQETIHNESPQKTVARNSSKPHGSWFAAPRPERQLPVGIFGGATATERWEDSVIHTDDCPRTGCRSCRPVSDRIEILERRLESQSPLFLLKSEKLTPLGR